MVILKQSTARKLPVLLADSAGAVKTGVAEGSVTVQISKNLAALGAFTLTSKWSEIGLGIYAISFAAGDLNTEGFFAYTVTVTGCDQYTGMMYVSDWETNVDSILEDTGTTLPAAITTTEGNIRGTDSDTLKTLSEQVDGVQTDTTAIKAKTDNLPIDPADESLLEAAILATETNLGAAITDAEGNVRGGGDTLDILSDQIDFIIPALNAIKGAGWVDENLTTIDALIDAIKAKTDNLPTDPADESLLEAAITTTEDNIRGVDGDDLKALSDQLDLTALEATLTAIKGAGWVAENLTTIQAAIETDVLGNLTILDTAMTAQSVILAYLKQKESGRWRISNHQLTYYDDDGVTPLKVFNLFNEEGSPTSVNPYERVPTD